VDATRYDGMYTALERFRCRPRNGKPTAIICHTTKGHGALSDFLNKHKVTVPEPLLEQEIALQLLQRGERENDYSAFIARSRPTLDMPSIDEEALIGLCQLRALICLAEQNNGYILQNLLKVMYRQCPDVATSALQRIVAINTLDADGRHGSFILEFMRS
jgi:hypothetical protein